MKHFIKENTWLPNYYDKGWGNGYVCIPKGHPCHGLGYDEIHSKYPDLEVHGGLTFADPSNELDWPEIPKECKKGFWIVGFDTAHYQDSMTAWPKIMVNLEAQNLAKQLSEIK